MAEQVKMEFYEGELQYTPFPDVSDQDDSLSKSSKTTKAPKKTGKVRHNSDGKGQKKGFSWTSIWQNKARPSAFSPYRPTTILTNLSRGNVPHDTPSVGPLDVTVYQLAARGELNHERIKPETGIDEKDSDGLTPLMWASAYGQFPTVRSLVESGCKVGYESVEGQTALHFSASAGHYTIVRFLLDHGAKADCEDENACTPLMYAAYGNHPQCAKELLDAGADLTAVNLHSQNAYTIAVNSGSKLVQAVFDKHLFNALAPRR